MSTQLGTIGETVVKLEFLRKGYEVYIGDDNTYLDFVVLNMVTHELSKVEVKTTRRRNTTNTGWIIDLRRSYGDFPFENDKVDYVAVYIEPLDRVKILDAKKITVKSSLTILDTDL